MPLFFLINFPQNLPEIFTFLNSYEFHSHNFYILCKNFINNYSCIYKLYSTIPPDQNCRNVYTNECRKIWVSGAEKIIQWVVIKRQKDFYPAVYLGSVTIFFFLIWRKIWKNLKKVLYESWIKFRTILSKVKGNIKYLNLIETFRMISRNFEKMWKTI